MWADEDIDCVCSTRGEPGIEALRRLLVGWVEGVWPETPEGGIVASLRVTERLEEVKSSLDKAISGLEPDAIGGRLVELERRFRPLTMRRAPDRRRDSRSDSLRRSV